MPKGACIRFFGMRRSGNHAVISWIQRNLPEGEAIFFNNCQPGAPMQTFQSVDFAGRVDERRNLAKPQNAQVVAALNANWRHAAHHLISYEDKTIAALAGQPPQGPDGYAPGLPWRDVLIYRRFLNWLASFYMLVKRKRPNPVRHSLRQGLPHYRALLAEVDTPPSDAVVAISYDRWGTDPAHRAALLDRLGLPLRDNSLGEVSHYGGGSSFTEAGEPAAAKVKAERWTGLTEDAGFRTLLEHALQDDRLCALVERHFPEDLAIAHAALTGAAAGPR